MCVCVQRRFVCSLICLWRAEHFSNIVRDLAPVSRDMYFSDGCASEDRYSTERWFVKRYRGRWECGARVFLGGGVKIGAGGSRS